MNIKNKELHRVVPTAIIYRKQGKDISYLITQRSLDKEVFPGKWTVPGGGLETDDYINTPKTTKDHWYFAIEKTLRREIKEESNLEVGKIKYLLDIVFIRPDNIPVVTLSFYCPYKSGRVKLDEDNIDYVWLTYQQAKKYDLIEGILEEIEMVDKILKGENEDKVQYKR
ncbi:MAG: NUDIX domain-containing protein [Candidatus Portnoybacteria bacterium]|nr:NUDIX domain-containing protein [Candidatus Portnoybacteria bacterium]